MSDEAVRLRRMFQELEEQNVPMLFWACSGLGINQERTSVEWDDRTPMGQLYESYTIDMLCDRVEYLIENEGILSSIVIGGLLNHLVDMFDYMGDPNKVPDSIDTSMDMLDGLKRMRGMPFEERPAPLSDKSLDRMIGQIEESFGRVRPHQQQCERIATMLKAQWNEKFPLDYFCKQLLGHLSKIWVFCFKKAIADIQALPLFLHPSISRRRQCRRDL